MSQIQNNFDEVVPFRNEHGRNDRFSYAKVRSGNEWFFLKTARTPELAENLQREFIWSEFMDYVASKQPDARIRAPRMIGHEEGGGLLMEYIDAPQVAVSNDVQSWRANIDRYALTLVTLDTYAGSWQHEWPNSSGLASMQDVDKVWRRWFGNAYDGIDGLSQARQIIETYRPTMTTRVQHGDLTPWQIFVDGDEWIIYDGEKAGNHLPRYNDLAYGYGRLFTRLKDPDTAALLLRKFLDYSDVDHSVFFEDFLPIMTFRAVGMMADSRSDLDIDYKQEAAELLRLCYGGEIDDFLSVSKIIEKL